MPGISETASRRAKALLAWIRPAAHSVRLRHVRSYVCSRVPEPSRTLHSLPTSPAAGLVREDRTDGPPCVSSYGLERRV
ncbi:hypothetical protein BV20DRAFT_965656 [Pilatotrama ljubarskyi]|nr:hypothetical protein BV20DRAFT_965656 [Pilatotrama ljubarskyi]